MVVNVLLCCQIFWDATFSDPDEMHKSYQVFVDCVAYLYMDGNPV